MKLTIYTDGACSGNPSPGGWAYAIPLAERVYQQSGHDAHTTNNRMELQAVLEAFKKVSERVQANDKMLGELMQIEVMSDSAYVVNGFNNNWVKTWERNGWKTKKHEPVKNAEQWKDISELKEWFESNNVRVKFTKVKAHNGNVLNELVDSLAVAQKQETKKNQKLKKE